MVYGMEYGTIYGMTYGMEYGAPYGAGWDDTIHNAEWSDHTFWLFRWAPPLEQSRITAFAFSGGEKLSQISDKYLLA